jgi:hypothetical protein
MCQQTLLKVVLKRHRSLESDDAAKVACHVREGAVGKGLSQGNTSLAAYFMSQE